MKILALDSGIERTGYAVFKNSGELKLIDFGCIETKRALTISKRILNLGKSIQKIIKIHKPDKLVLERLFFNTNQKTAMTVAQAQGSTIFVAARESIDVEFITPLQIKLSVAGFGRADKRAVEKMVQLTLNMETLPKPDDIVDAIACGLAYCLNNHYDRKT